VFPDLWDGKNIGLGNASLPALNAYIEAHKQISDAGAIEKLVDEVYQVRDPATDASARSNSRPSAVRIDRSERHTSATDWRRVGRGTAEEDMPGPRIVAERVGYEAGRDGVLTARAGTG
jgi:hypothetical protein